MSLLSPKAIVAAVSFVAFAGAVAGFLEYQARYGAASVVDVVAAGDVVILQERRSGSAPRGPSVVKRLVSVAVASGEPVARVVGGGPLLGVAGGKVVTSEPEGLVVRDAHTLAMVSSEEQLRARVGKLADGTLPCREPAGDAFRMTTDDGRFLRVSVPDLATSSVPSATCASDVGGRREFKLGATHVALKQAAGSAASALALVDARGERVVAQTFLAGELLDANIPGHVLVTHESGLGGDRAGMLTLVSLADAKAVWQVRLRSERAPDAVVLSGDLLVVRGSGSVAAVDARSGALRWSRGDP